MSHLAGHDVPTVDVVNRREKLERGLVLLLMETSDVFPPKAHMCKFYGTSEGYFYTDPLIHWCFISKVQTGLDFFCLGRSFPPREAPPEA